MAEYTNNLRLKEIATGDESGTWGTSTNTNLELIGEALGFGTEAITTNADTHATTIADGSSDAGRAMYIKYTGTLDSECTITIGPNTMKRVHIIENGTSGSQNIIISQGSGANVTIPPGDAKAVYLDGAGSGAAVADAFASLSVVDLKVQDDLSLTSDSAVLNMGADNDVTLTHDGTTGVTIAANPITLDSAGDIVLDADGADIIFKDGGTAIAHLTNSSSDFVIETKVQDKDFIIKGDDGGSGITALTIDMSSAGAATFNNDVTAFSDKRLKTDIEPIANALQKVMAMQGVYYKRNDVENAKTQVGVLAQDMEAILPEVVMTADDDMQTKSVDYGKLTSVLIEAIKELSNDVITNRLQLEKLKQQIINGG
jgi:hypothetical protein